MSEELTRPEEATDNALEYLDDLRDSAETNMYGAGPYLMAAFGLTKEQARAVLQYWIDTFGDRHPED